jgi:hypothetical protein
MNIYEGSLYMYFQAEWILSNFKECSELHAPALISPETGPPNDLDISEDEYILYRVDHLLGNYREKNMFPRHRIHTQQ